MCCTRLAGNTGRKIDAKIAICAPSHKFVGLYLCNEGTYRQSEKIVKQRYLFHMSPYNMVIFGPLADEFLSSVWSTPANFNGFRFLAVVLHGTLYSSGRQPNFAALNRGRHLYSAGRPSRWALAHFLVQFYRFICR